MTEIFSAFDVCFECAERQYNLKAKFVRLGFIHQFHVEYEDSILIVEFDEERNYRVMDADPRNEKKIDTSILEAIVQKLSSFH